MKKPVKFEFAFLAIVLTLFLIISIAIGEETQKE